jgi:8-oxo-dGTP diphosphatase
MALVIPEGIKKTAVLCVLKSGNDYLLLKRLKAPNQGMYTPVGGKLDPHESPLAAAFRETFEETGISANEFSFCGILEETSPVDYNWISFVYVAEIPFQPAPPCNEGILEWIPGEELKDLNTPATDWLIYQYISKRRHFVFNAIFDEHLHLQEMSDALTGAKVYDASKL